MTVWAPPERARFTIMFMTYYTTALAFAQRLVESFLDSAIDCRITDEARDELKAQRHVLRYSSTKGKANIQWDDTTGYWVIIIYLV